MPCELHPHLARARRYPASVMVTVNDRVVARHNWLSNAVETHHDWQHAIPLLHGKSGERRNRAPCADLSEPLQQLRRGLLRHPGRHRLTAQVLATVLTAGLDAVPVTMALASETGVHHAAAGGLATYEDRPPQPPDAQRRHLSGGLDLGPAMRLPDGR